MAPDAQRLARDPLFSMGAVHAFCREQGDVRMRFVRHCLRDGLYLLRSEASPRSARPTPFELTLNPVHCHLGALLEGSLQLESVDRPRPVALSDGDWFVATGEGQRTVKIVSTGPLRLFTIETDRTHLERFFQQSDPANEWLVRDLCELSDQRPRFLSGPRNAALNGLTQELGAEQGEDFAAHLRLESLVLRWLAELLVQPPLRRDGTRINVSSTEDRAAILAAARFLEENLADKHSTARLSRQVHLNEFKLKRGFRTLFGTSIMGYLRAKRMERAASLLSSGEFGVLETAGKVGYENPSHFARAFRAHHGLPPKRFQRENLHGQKMP